MEVTRKHAGTRTRTPVNAAFALLLARLLAACSSTKLPTIADAPPKPPVERQALLSPADQREHLRILAAYGGVYRNPALQAMLEKTVYRLVAASERPDLKYD